MIENEQENNLKQSLINNNNESSSKELSFNNIKTFSNSHFSNSNFTNSNFIRNSKFTKNSTNFSYNKSKRYKIGISFFILYLTLNSLDSILISYFDYDFKINIFGEIYLRMSFLFIFIFLSVFFPKTTKKLTLFNLMKFYVPDWKKNMNFENDNLNTNFYIHEGTTEKFNKTIHKISFLFMFLLYFSLCFYTKSYSNGILNHKKNKKIFIISLSFPLGLIMIVMILRRFFLFSKKFDKLSKISISFLILGIGFLSIFEIENFDHQHHHEIFFYSFFGGIFYGFYSTFLKYFYIYGKNFNIEKILGYIGIYTFICCPFFLCLILWLNYNKNTIHMFEFGNNKICYFLMFFINVVNYIIQIHCIISLSPFIFGFATFVSVLILFTIHVCLGNLKSDCYYFLGLGLILIGTFVGIFDKYLKQRKNNKLKK